MTVELKIPEMGESVTEVYIGQWSKKEGERVEQDEQLVELESEKATLDLRAPAAGILSKILKKSGDTAEVGEVIGQIDAGAVKKPPTEADDSPTSDDDQAKAETKPVSDGKPSAAEKPGKTETPTTDKEAEPGQKEEKIVQKQEKPVEKKAEQPADSEQQEKVSRGDKETAKTAPGDERVPMSPIRRRIAARLVEAQHNAALLTTFNEIDMTAVKALRTEHGEAFERKHGVRLGFMSFFVKATLEALRQLPELNAMIDGDDIVYRHTYDIGVAISTDKGLVVPVLRDAERMAFAQIEQAIEEYAKKAREGALTVDELQGGTFTITNGGVFGSLLSTPIVNPPQSGVLGMHAIQNRPVAIDNEIVIRPMMYVALTYDHRIVDGREAVTFLRRIKETIEEPARMLLEV